jgi:prevent-host-death family protein
MMQRTVSAQDARQRLGELLESVYYRGDSVIIERAGKPMGVVISPRRFAEIERRREEARQRLFAKMDQIHERTKNEDPEEIEEMVLSEIAAYRREKREALDRARPSSGASTSER